MTGLHRYGCLLIWRSDLSLQKLLPAQQANQIQNQGHNSSNPEEVTGCGGIFTPGIILDQR